MDHEIPGEMIAKAPDDDYGDESDDHDYDDESNDEDLETEVEQHEFSLPGDHAAAIQIKLFVTEEIDVESPFWLKNLHVRCTHNGRDIAHALARSVSREHIRSKFWERMEEVSQDMCDVAFDTFTRYGTLKPKLISHPVQKGTGAWGDELSHGPLLVIELIHVTANDFRHKGLGSMMMSLLLDKANRQVMNRKPAVNGTTKYFYGSMDNFERAWTLHAISIPGSLRADLEPQWQGKSAIERHRVDTKAIDGAERFLRACGFRRIGSSISFGYSFDENRKSREFQPTDDFNPQRRSEEYVELRIVKEEEMKLNGISMEDSQLEILKERFPLHYAVSILNDDECVRIFENKATDDTAWNEIDFSGSTLLHAAACEIKPRLISWLLKLPQAQTWIAARDINGFTPQEALQEKLDKARTQRQFGMMTVDVSDRFNGYPDLAVLCLYALASSNYNQLPMPAVAIRHLRHGCTCGECLEGFLSPRMAFGFRVQAEILGDTLESEIEDGETWVEFNDYKIRHVEPDVQENFKTNKSLRRGFTNIFSLAARCLESKVIPRVGTILEQHERNNEWPPVTKNYLHRAGVEHGITPVLLYMFEQTMGQDTMVGDGEAHLESLTEWAELPACRNDYEYGLAANAWGLQIQRFA
ncbi:hypothetical protein BJX70DRAFT_410287 [Aspergillus crustosus]